MLSSNAAIVAVYATESEKTSQFKIIIGTLYTKMGLGDNIKFKSIYLPKY